MFRRWLGFPLLIFGATLTHSFADILVLKSGERIEGKVVQESDQSLTVQVYAGDRTLTSVARTDLQEVLADNQEISEFLAIRNDANIPTALGSDIFTQLLNRKIPAFKAKYPQTKYRAALDQIVQQLNADKARQNQGWVKIAGVWLNHDQLDSEKYQVNAALLHEAMESAAARGDWIAALNTFQNLRVNYPLSRAYVMTIDLAIQILPRLRQLEEEKRQSYRLDLLQINLALGDTPEHLRADLVNATRRESEQLDAAIADQRRTGVKWATVAPRSEKAFDEIHQQIAEELSGLRKLPRGKYHESIDAAVQATQVLAGGDIPSAQSFLRRAQAAWQENEMIGRIQSAVNEAEKISAAKLNPRSTAEETSLPMLVQKHKYQLLTGGGMLLLLFAAWGLIRRAQRSRRRLIG